MNLDLFLELSIILLITIGITGIVLLLRQPAIIGYILSGIIAGPFVLDIISSTDELTALAKKGVALLLFIVGLNLNPRIIKDVGKVSLITGVTQVLFTTTLGFLISNLFGFSILTSFYIAFALAFSSTIVIMKLLSDKKQLESLYGRIAIGFLIVQDLIVIIFLIIVSSLSGEAGAQSTIDVLFKGIGAILLLGVCATMILPRVTKFIARSQEFLFLFSLGWCFSIASLFHYLNFSIEAGALLAGIALAASPYHFEITAKMRPLRDFFLILFFIVMGSQMAFGNVALYYVEIIIFSLLVLIGNPLIVIFIMGRLGYTRRNSFLAGLTVAQISEFSLVIISFGMNLGHIEESVSSLITSVALLTFTGSTYMILHSEKLYTMLSPYLTIFERKGKKVDVNTKVKRDSHDIILFGYNRVGYDILESLTKIKKKFLIIDYDPEVIKNLSASGYDCLYGDANSSELLNDINFRKSKMVISTISTTDTSLLLLTKVREINDKAIVAVVANHVDDALKLYENGATYVIMPHILGGLHFSTMISKNRLGVNKFLKDKISHIEHIKRHKETRKHYKEKRHEQHVAKVKVKKQKKKEKRVAKKAQKQLKKTMKKTSKKKVVKKSKK